MLWPMSHARLAAAFAAALAAVLPAQQTPVPIRLAVSGLDDSAPLTMAATLDGERLKVQVALQAGWHLYGKDTGNGQPVRNDTIGLTAHPPMTSFTTPLTFLPIIFPRPNGRSYTA